MIICSKDAGGIPNNVDPHQTASIRVYTVYPDLSLRKHKIIRFALVTGPYSERLVLPSDNGAVQCDSNEYAQHMILWRTDENYPSIIIKYPPYLAILMCTHNI